MGKHYKNSFMSQTTLPERVLEWTKTYCDSLTENYKQHSDLIMLCIPYLSLIPFNECIQ